ncbi:MAG: hypothetical protein LW669_03125 [Sphingobacteriales bacterium]|jgi:hypothetical protein|nr:hypothetical protein [Sphingobacteriales bacterium]
MNKLKCMFLLLLVWQLTTTSCKKADVDKNEQDVSAAPKKFTEMKVNQNFTWSTTKVIQLNFKSIPNDPRNAVLRVVDADGVVYFKKLQSANQKFNGSIVVPSHITKLKYIYGSIQQEFNANAGVVNIDVK